MKTKLTKREMLAVSKFGSSLCIAAYQSNVDGNGANTIGWDVLNLPWSTPHGQATMWGDRAIDAGRKLCYME